MFLVHDPSCLPHLADILMGAVQSDGDITQAEVRTVRRALESMSPDATLPGDLIDHMLQFQIDQFDLVRACKELRLKTAEDRRMLLKLVLSVNEADEVDDLDESAYLLRVARAIGAKPDEVEDLVMNIVSIEPNGSVPPPLPKE